MNNDVFETMPVPKAYFKMALPVVFGMVISLVYNMVDTWFIVKDPEHQPRRRRLSLRPGVQSHDCIPHIFRALAEVPHLDFSEKRRDTARRISAFCLLLHLLRHCCCSDAAFSDTHSASSVPGTIIIAYAGAYYRFLGSRLPCHYL